MSLHGGGMMMSIIELMHQIVREPAPRLAPEGRFPRVAEEFVNGCLGKDPGERKTPKELMVGFPLALVLFCSRLTDLWYILCRRLRG